MTPMNNSIEILHSWEHNIGHGRYDQQAWNRALKQSSGQFKYGALDGAKGFPTGTEYLDGWNHTQHARVRLVHNNWIAGRKMKKRRFQRHQMWQLSGRLDKVAFQCRRNIANSTAANSTPKIR